MHRRRLLWLVVALVAVFGAVTWWRLIGQPLSADEMRLIGTWARTTPTLRQEMRFGSDRVLTETWTTIAGFEDGTPPPPPPPESTCRWSFRDETLFLDNEFDAVWRALRPIRRFFGQTIMQPVEQSLKLTDDGKTLFLKLTGQREEWTRVGRSDPAPCG
jgi:hypothetical protein